MIIEFKFTEDKPNTYLVGSLMNAQVYRRPDLAIATVFLVDVNLISVYNVG